MSPKSTLFLLAFVLVVTRMVSSVEEFNNVETKAPVYAPNASPTAPAYAPASPLPYGFGTACVAMCASYCRPNNPRRQCMRTCTACCAKFRCVPEFSKCCEWGEVTIHRTIFKCPPNYLS